MSLAVGILMLPHNIRVQIQGTGTVLLDSKVSNIQYGGQQAQGPIRVASFTWEGRALEYLPDSYFDPIDLAQPGPGLCNT